MFSDSEINGLRKLVDTTSSPNDVLEKDEEIIVTNINLIRDSIFVPKQKRDIQTIMLKKLVTDDFDMTEMIKSICQALSPQFELRIGLSFIADNPKNDLLYFFAIRNRPINNHLRYISTNSDVKNSIRFFSKLSREDLLNFVFEQNNNLNAFDKSGFRPRKLVLATFWITKFAHTSNFDEPESDESDNEIDLNDI